MAAGAPASFGLIDIGANLTDGMFVGKYHGKHRHEADLDLVLERAFGHGVVSRIIITGTNLAESRESVELANTDPRLFCTVGVHPTRAGEFRAAPDRHMESLLSLIRENETKVVAVGECGLDYDRLHFCKADVQRTFFERQFDLAEATRLPMFLHDRNTGTDFLEMMRRHVGRTVGGVVHSFTGTVDEARALLDLGLYIGINGCSMKTAENLDAVRIVPEDRLLIETDAPWCEIKPTHASFPYVKTKFPTKKNFERGFCVKARCEPVHVLQVLEAVAGVRGLEGPDELARLAAVVNANTMRLFSRMT